MLASLTTSPSGLEQLWFTLIGVLWLGYFFLEGFDFGVGTLMPFVSKDDLDRRVVINTIGPVWDGNEVWLLTAGCLLYTSPKVRWEPSFECSKKGARARKSSRKWPRSPRP